MPCQWFAPPLANNTPKKEPTPTVQWIVSSVETNAGTAKKYGKGKPSMPTFHSVGKLIGIWQSLKKGRSNDRATDGSIPLLGNQLPKTQKSKEAEGMP